MWMGGKHGLIKYAYSIENSFHKLRVDADGLVDEVEPTCVAWVATCEGCKAVGSS